MALDLAEQLESQPIQALRRVAAEAAGLAIMRIQLADPRLDAALATVRKGALSDPAERSRVRELTAELDEIAWDMQDKAEQGILPRQAYP